MSLVEFLEENGTPDISEVYDTAPQSMSHNEILEFSGENLNLLQVPHFERRLYEVDIPKGTRTRLTSADIVTYSPRSLELSILEVKTVSTSNPKTERRQRERARSQLGKIRNYLKPLGPKEPNLFLVFYREGSSHLEIVEYKIEGKTKQRRTEVASWQVEYDPYRYLFKKAA